ncbi:MAG: hypothetical protein ABIJ23_01555 [Candidatus Magasanikbacteria bacterium]
MEPGTPKQEHEKSEEKIKIQFLSEFELDRQKNELDPNFEFNQNDKTYYIESKRRILLKNPCIRMDYGNKVLFLKIIFYEGITSSDKGSFHCSTHVVNKPNSKKITGQTTEVYSKVQEIITKHIQKHKEKAIYRISTTNKNMCIWALTKGRNIFDWNEITIRDKNDKQIDPENFIENFDDTEITEAEFNTIITPTETN